MKNYTTMIFSHGSGETIVLRWRHAPLLLLDISVGRLLSRGCSLLAHHYKIMYEKRRKSSRTITGMCDRLHSSQTRNNKEDKQGHSFWQKTWPHPLDMPFPVALHPAIAVSSDRQRVPMPACRTVWQELKRLMKTQQEHATCNRQRSSHLAPWRIRTFPPLRLRWVVNDNVLPWLNIASTSQQRNFACNAPFVIKYYSCILIRQSYGRWSISQYFFGSEK